MVKKGDFIIIEYTGYDENGNIFDSTSGEIAKQVHGKEGSLLIFFGVDSMVQGMENAITSMKNGEEIEFSLSPDKAFGVKDKNKINVLPLSEFDKNEFKLYSGLIVQMETKFGVLNGKVKTVNNGRVLIDFNHPLAGQNVKYKLKLVEVLDDVNGKINGLMAKLGVEGTFDVNGVKITISLNKGQTEEELKKARLTLAIKNMIPEIKEVEFKKNGSSIPEKVQ